MGAYARRLSGLREIVERFGERLNTDNFSSLSHALRRAASLKFVQGLVERLQAKHLPGCGELVAVDSMAVTLPATQRHRCKKYNKRTVGGGVLWAFIIDAARERCPVRVIKTVAGTWCDAQEMIGVELIGAGPVYLMDRGFYGLKLIEQWAKQKIRFIVRARNDAAYTILGELSAPRPYGPNGRIELDARVSLGCPSASAHPKARLIQATVGKQKLILVTSEMRWSAKRVLDAYKKRERIERFHRQLKETVGLAHLYSFSQKGIEFLIYTALLVAMLLVMEAAEQGGEVIYVLKKALRNMRRSFGLGNIWKRNTYLVKRAKASRQNR
jgi:hypothetical protein